MRLQADPMLILEYFLWRKRSEFAISNHYDRHCVWEEVLQNKRLNKYNHSAIDEQFQFYLSDGLIKFNESDRSAPLRSCLCHFHVLVEQTLFFSPCHPMIYFVITVFLQMYLKVHLLCVHTHLCQIYFHAFGLMK